MKIRKIKYENHPILGNIELDFTDKAGKTVNTIIIAGENGVGKSLILNSIFQFSKYDLENLPKNEKAFWELEFSIPDIELLKLDKRFLGYFKKEIKSNFITVEIDYSIMNSWDQYIITAITADGENVFLPPTLFIENDLKRILKTIYSDVEINFTPQTINSVTSKNIDEIANQSERSGSNLATEITQLLIDVQNLDALEFTDWGRQNKGKSVDHEKIDVRMRRFTSAFEFMFPSKKYKRIDNINNKKKIVFEENNLEMDIDQLSSGEKQIVFRGSFLLKNKESSKGAIILIDEPEISLHPEWQLKIINFFKKLFTNSDGIQTSQLIITTHSPFIIHNASRNEDKVIVLQKNTEGTIMVLEEPMFYTWSTEKIVHEAFNVTHILNSTKTIIFVEGITDELYFNKCIEVFNQHDRNIEFKWIGRINESGNVENSGSSALNHAYTFFLANMDFLKSKIILLYDIDTNKPENVHGFLHIKKMLKNEGNSLFKIGVENLLNLPEDFDPNAFYSTTTTPDNYGGSTVKTALNKSNLCSNICETLTDEQSRFILTNLNREIIRLHSEE